MTIDYTGLLFACIPFLLSVGFFLFSLRSQAAQATASASLIHMIKPLNDTIRTLKQTIEENGVKIVDLIKITDALHDQANDAKAQARRYETLFYETKAMMEYFMNENLILRNTIFVPADIFNVDTPEKPDSIIPSGIPSSGTPNSDTAEDAPSKKGRNRARRRNKRAMKSEPKEKPADKTDKGKELENENGDGDKPRTGVSAWNSFQATFDREEAARQQRAAEQSVLRKAEEDRTGVRDEPPLPEFKETWKQVKVDSDQRRIVGVTKGQSSQ